MLAEAPQPGMGGRDNNAGIFPPSRDDASAVDGDGVALSDRPRDSRCSCGRRGGRPQQVSRRRHWSRWFGIRIQSIVLVTTRNHAERMAGPPCRLPAASRVADGEAPCRSR